MATTLLHNKIRLISRYIVHLFIMNILCFIELMAVMMGVLVTCTMCGKRIIYGMIGPIKWHHPPMWTAGSKLNWFSHKTSSIQYSWLILSLDAFATQLIKFCIDSHWYMGESQVPRHHLNMFWSFIIFVMPQVNQRCIPFIWLRFCIVSHSHVNGLIYINSARSKSKTPNYKNGNIDMPMVGYPDETPLHYVVGSFFLLEQYKYIHHTNNVQPVVLYTCSFIPDATLLHR